MSDPKTNHPDPAYRLCCHTRHDQDHTTRCKPLTQYVKVTKATDMAELLDPPELSPEEYDTVEKFYAAPPDQVDRDTEADLAADIVADRIQKIGAHAAALNAELRGIGGLDFDALVELLGRVSIVREAVQVSEAALQLAAWKARGDRYGDVEVPGVGVVSVRRTTNRKTWNHDDLASEVVDRHMEATGGELPDPDTVREWILEAAGIAYWKVSTLKALDISVDEFCVTERGNPKIDLPKRDVHEFLGRSSGSD